MSQDNRDIIETKLLEPCYLSQVDSVLDADAEQVFEIEHTGTSAQKMIKYSYYRESDGAYVGEVNLAIYAEGFQARGDVLVMEKYFSDDELRDLV